MLMLDLPGYTLVGSPRKTRSNLLFHAIRAVDDVSVILKTPVGSVLGPSERERYRRELSILRHLQGVRGVIEPLGCEFLGDRPVLILEQVKGQPLSESTGTSFDIARFLGLAICLSSILADVHRRDVIHKDIKPGNIILTPEGQVRLIDFGAATIQRVEHVEASPATLLEGTLAYMSPEQTGRMNRSLDYRTDLYSLGVSFYELLTGAPPFQGRDALEWIHAHMAQMPRPPCELNPQVPPVLSAMVMRLLAKAPEERYQSAEGLEADLERCREVLRQGSVEPFALGTNDFPSRLQPPQRLYGRAPHVALLLQGFEQVASSGQPDLLLVSGYSGIGKSSVVNELHKPVVQRRGFFLSGKFDQLQHDIPYSTLAQALRGLVQHLLSGADEELSGWRQRLLAAWKGEGRVLVDVVPQLELVVGAQPPVQALPPGEAQHRFHRVFAESLRVFATPQHPLVVFLDDMQWADMASLQLLQLLLTREDSPAVLWVGAYRDNEVSPTHPLTLALAEVREAGVRVSGIQLAPLSLEDTRHFVADALPGAGHQVLAPLATQLYELTGGNPFFLLQFLLTLHQDGLIARTPEGGWRWDAEGVRAKGYADNVADFMVGKLRQLPLGTQHLLRLAACVGSHFPLWLLATLCDTEVSQAEQGLERAIQEGLLVRTGSEQYRFLHDRIQQAAYALIPENERSAMHLRIGRLMLANSSPEQVRERLFEVVGQLNAGVDLLETPEERLHVARLNAEAGHRARAAIAHRAAITYLSTAFSLIPGDPWRTDPELAFQVLLERATSELLMGNPAEARRLVEVFLPRAHSPEQLAAAYSLKSDLHLAAAELRESLACMLECLERLGMPMPLHPSWQEAAAAHEEVWALMAGRSVESLIELPPATDPKVKVAMNMFANLFGPTLFTDINLFILHLAQMVSLSLRHGSTEASSHGYVWFGVVSAFWFKKYREGYDFSVLAREFVERNNLYAFRGKTLFGQGIVSCWYQPLVISRDLHRESFQQALQVGDYQTACYSSCQLVKDRLCLGDNLDEIYQESLALNDFVRKTGFLDVQEIHRYSQSFVQQMRGLSRSFDTLDTENFEERSFEATLNPARMPVMLFLYWLTKMQSRFMCGAYREALEAAGQAAQCLNSVVATIQLLDFHLYRALVLAALHEESSEQQQQQNLEALQQHHRQLEEWARACPENFRAPERMVAAELARITGRLEQALSAYEEAIQSARDNGFPHLLGVACELAANFYRKRNAPLIAHAYAREARLGYLGWGAQGKVQQLDSLWPQLAPPLVAPGTLTTDTDSTQLDALTVIKAQQAISSQLLLDQLVATLLRVALENVGAQHGALLLLRGDKLEVAVRMEAARGELRALPLERDGQLLPWSILTYVKRTHEHVLISDASRPHLFSSDPYLEHSKARSVFCLPLMSQGAFSGALYLQNNLAAGAFTPARLAVLEHLASQSAISLQSAHLYEELQRAEAALRRSNDELERRVEERTRALKEMQAQLVDTARAAGMAEIASNVLHNVGNVLTSTVINLEMMSRAAESSRISRLKTLSGLVQEHRSSLSDFLTHDARGSRVPDYLSALTEELLREHSQLRQNIREMNTHIEHIRSIVQVQQTYAKTTLLLDECELSLLVEDALRLQLASFQRHRITLSRDFAPLPKVQVDKHKVLQILINLMSNAKWAMDQSPEGSRRLHLRLSAQGKVARLQVVDSGIGFTQEVRKKLFSHGFTTRENGHGFGLHSSALAAQQLGGRLLLDSDGPGQGATATLELPLP